MYSKPSFGVSLKSKDKIVWKFGLIRTLIPGTLDQSERSGVTALQIIVIEKKNAVRAS